tara:strand:+ start:163 stop:624 length:462 start_codon:yes stop_codon:yes gene_type:complete
MKNLILIIFGTFFLISCSNGDNYLVCDCYVEKEFIENELVDRECKDWPASSIFTRQSLSFNEKRNTINWANKYEHIGSRKTKYLEIETNLEFTDNEIVFLQTVRNDIIDGEIRTIEGFSEVKLNRISLLATERNWGNQTPYERLFKCSVTEVL